MNTIKLFRHIAEAIYFDQNAIIFEEGEYGDVMYLVEEGQIDIFIGDERIERVEVGGVIGEMALINKLPRSATAVAHTPCKLIPINQQAFKMHVQLTPMFALQVMRTLARRMQAMNERILKLK